MRLFLYGSLLEPLTLARHVGRPLRGARAVLPGWRRTGLRGSRYPTLARCRCGGLTGLLVEVDARALARLSAYEGPRYRRRAVTVSCAGRPRRACCWIADAPTHHPWR